MYIDHDSKMVNNILMEVAETEDFQRVDFSPKSTQNMKCHSTRSSLLQYWLSSLVASFLARPGRDFLIGCTLCLITRLSAFNAIISASVVALGISYAIPPAINCLRGRKMLPPRPFVLPGPLGWMCNLLGIAYVIVTTVLFLFPPDLPVTGSNMSTLYPMFFFSYCHSSPPIIHLKICSPLPHSVMPFINHPISPSALSPFTYSKPPHTLTVSNPRLLHRRLLHRHRHKRSAMVRRRPQELQRPRSRTSRRRRRARLRRRQRRRQA